MGIAVPGMREWVPMAVGLAAGAIVAYADNYAFGGEISPAIIVGMLLAVTAALGAVLGRRGWLPGMAAWTCIPLAHLARHVLGMPDTLRPNTYGSIMLLAAFTLGVAIVGVGCGLMCRKVGIGTASRASEPT